MQKAERSKLLKGRDSLLCELAYYKYRCSDALGFAEIAGGNAEYSRKTLEIEQEKSKTTALLLELTENSFTPLRRINNRQAKRIRLLENVVSSLRDIMNEIDKGFGYEGATHDKAPLLSGQVMAEGVGAMKDW